MSLTSFLKSPEAIELFKSFPDVAPHLVLCKGSLYKPNGLVVPRLQGADPAIVGTAYDFCCRAIVQRVNGLLIEEELSPVLESGLRALEAFRFSSGKELKNIQSETQYAWKTRIDYIKGEPVSIQTLAVDSLKMARVEQAYRSGRLMPSPLTEENINDMCALIHCTMTSNGLLRTKEKMYMNPTFGHHSTLVGGADADMVFGTTLIDIKTTVHKRSFQEYFQQLFGYYLLSELDKTFDASLQNLAVYLPRYDALYFVRLDVLRSLIDIDAFAKQFLDLIEEYQLERL